MPTTNPRKSSRLQLKQLGSNMLQVAVDVNTPKAPAKSNFAVHSRSANPCREHISATRRDYYKISLVTKGGGTLTLGERTYEVKAPAMMFVNPVEAKTWKPVGEQDGYYCMFTEYLFEQQRHYRDELLHYPLFQIGAHAVLPLTDAQCEQVEGIFKQLVQENGDIDIYKQEAIVIYLLLLLLEAKRIGASDGHLHRSLTTAQLLAERFADALEKQFPITSDQEQVQLKTAGDFAQVLNIHPNHLNATVKRVTGRTTSEHIRQRILLEARLLLLHTDWQIASIARCLGFEEPANFTHFFKSHIGHTPHHFRSL